MAYGDFKDLNIRIIADKVLRDKAFNVAKNPKYDRYQSAFASMIYNFLIKKLLAEQLKMKLFLINQLLENFRREKYTHIF